MKELTKGDPVALRRDPSITGRVVWVKGGMVSVRLDKVDGYNVEPVEKVVSLRD